MENEKESHEEYSIEVNLTSTGKPSFSVKVKTSDPATIETKLDELLKIAETRAKRLMA